MQIVSSFNKGCYILSQRVSNYSNVKYCVLCVQVIFTPVFYPRSLTASHGAAGILQAVSLTLCMALVLLALLALVLWFHRSGHDRKWREEGEEEECYNEIRYTPELLRKSFV